MSMWGTFTALRGSSTRCEIATAMVAMLRRRAVHIATDSFVLVKKGNAYLEHLRDREATKLREEDGTLILGGRTSHLHRRAPWKQKWVLMKDGDLWRQFGTIAEAKKTKAIAVEGDEHEAVSSIQRPVPPARLVGGWRSEVAATGGQDMFPRPM